MSDEPRRSELGDDAIIGLWLRRSLVAVALVGLVAGLAWWLSRPRPVAEAVVEKQITAPREARVAVNAPVLEFTDVARAAGVDFVHTSGAAGEKLLPETMGSGVAIYDHDLDGDHDVLLVDGSPWPWSIDDRQTGPRLYLNRGGWSFRDVSRSVGLDQPLYGMGAAVADADADGDPDLFLTAVGSNRLYRNDGGRYVDVTDAAGVGGAPEGWSTAATFFDADGDGDLDLLVADYIRWSRELDLAAGYTLNGRDRAYGPPTSFEGSWLTLWRNDGGLRFADVSDEAGVRITNPATGRAMAKALAVQPFDADGDGDLDVFVANDTVQNFLLVNAGDGVFEEAGAAAGVAFDGAGVATGAMGVDVATILDDGRSAVAVGNFANEMSSLYAASRVPGLFVDRAAALGLGAASRARLTFGLFFFDADLDGRLDLLQANGHLEEEISEVQASQSWRQPAQLFWNGGGEAATTFVEVPAEKLGDLARPVVGRGAAFGDLDGDGDLDVVITTNGDRPLVLRNDQNLGHHWLRVRLEGADPNPWAIGATLELTVGGRVLRRTVMPTRSYLSQSEREVTFGLGAARRCGPLEVRWPDGHRTKVTVEAVDRLLVVTRDDAL